MKISQETPALSCIRNVLGPVVFLKYMINDPDLFYVYFVKVNVAGTEVLVRIISCNSR
jgi:hypothetical protein